MQDVIWGIIAAAVVFRALYYLIKKRKRGAKGCCGSSQCHCK